MAAQSILIAETIAGMKKAIRRRDSSSDSDAFIDQSTNRGNKLKRKARYVHEGQLDMANGPRVYRRKIEYAGYQKYILSRNPRRFDDDGDELEHEDVDEDADAAAAEQNPYSGIKLENLLAPLTSASELPNHPSLSIPYFSKTLAEMTQQACVMLQREKASLWRMKQLLTKFRGDETWVPCGRLQTEDDITLFGGMHACNPEEAVSIKGDGVDGSLPNGQSQIRVATNHQGDPITQLSTPGQVAASTMLGEAQDAAALQTKAIKEELHGSQQEVVAADISIDDATDGEVGQDIAPVVDGVELVGKPEVIEHAAILGDPPKEMFHVTTAVPEAAREDVSNGERNPTEPTPTITEVDDHKLPSASVHQKPAPEDNGNAADPPEFVAALILQDERQEEGRSREEDGESSQPAQHRMTTRAQAQAASDNATTAPTRSPSPESTIFTYVHPLFVVPPSAHPDRDCGLPPAEAEETRRVLMSYVQKQEEVCRGVQKLYEGLLRADRMKKTVLQWCKAEEHVGEMSDGEDWYDKDAWALEEDLKKGHEEEEDEGGNQGKKTRGRRA